MLQNVRNRLKHNKTDPCDVRMIAKMDVRKSLGSVFDHSTFKYNIVNSRVLYYKKRVIYNYNNIDAEDGRYDIYHYRDREKREIDFLIEREDGALLGVEIKAGSAIEKKDFNHLKWFRDHLAQDRPFTGIILYTGEFPVPFGDNLWAVPLGLLWT